MWPRKHLLSSQSHYHWETRRVWTFRFRDVHFHVCTFAKPAIRKNWNVYEKLAHTSGTKRGDISIRATNLAYESRGRTIIGNSHTLYKPAGDPAEAKKNIYDPRSWMNSSLSWLWVSKIFRFYIQPKYYIFNIEFFLLLLLLLFKTYIFSCFICNEIFELSLMISLNFIKNSTVLSPKVIAIGSSRCWELHLILSSLSFEETFGKKVSNHFLTLLHEPVLLWKCWTTWKYANHRSTAEVRWRRYNGFS